MSLIIYEKKSLKIMLTRLGIFNLTLSYQLSGKWDWQLNNFSFLISNILCKIVVNHLLNNQNILKDIFEDKRGQWQKWWRRESVEMRLEFFESLNGITDFLLWKWFGKLFRSKWLFSWMSVRWILRLPDS